jgi:YVTN family beta-propeller protein
MSRAALLLLLSGCLRAGITPNSPPAPGPLVYVSAERGREIVVIDSGLDAVVAHIAVGARPRGIRLDRTGERLFAALSGSARGNPGVEPAALAAAEPPADGIALVDVLARRVATVLPAGPDPESFDLLADGRTLVVSNREAATASFLDVAAGQVLSSVHVGAEPEGVTAAPDGGGVAVASEREDRVDFIDPALGQVVARVPTCARPQSVAFTPDGALAFAPCEEGAAVAVIDARTHQPLGAILLGPTTRPMGAVVSPDGQRLYVSNGGAGSVSVVDVTSRAVVATVRQVGARPWGLDLTPDGRKLYVANGPSNDVTAIDTATLEVVARIPVGGSPWGVAVSP